MNNDSVKFGIIAGMAYVVIQMLIYFVSIEFMFGWTGIFSMLGIITVLAVWAIVSSISNKKKAQGGFIEFKEAFKEGFIAVVMISLITSAFNYMLYNFIDPGLIGMLKDFAVEGTASWIEGSVSEEQFEEIMEQMENEDYSITVLKTIGQVFQGILFGAFPTLIASAAMKVSGQPIDSDYKQAELMDNNEEIIDSIESK